MSIETAAKLFSQGNQLKQAGELTQATVAYRQAIALHPKFFGFHSHLADTLIDLQDWPGAIEALQRAIALNPNAEQAHYRLGFVLEQQGLLTEAIAAYQTALSLQPDNPLFQTRLNSLLPRDPVEPSAPEVPSALVTADHQEPESSPRSQVELSESFTCSTDWQEFYDQGNRSLQRQDWSEAIASYQQAAALSPENVTIHHNLGHAFAQLQQWSDAIISYQRAIALSPDSATLYLHLGHAYVGLHQWGEAATAYRRAIALDSSLVALPDLACRVLLSPQQGSQPTAALASPVLNQAIAITPNMVLLRLSGDLSLSVERQLQAWISPERTCQVYGAACSNGSRNRCLLLCAPQLGQQSQLSQLIIYQPDGSNWMVYPGDISLDRPTEFSQFLQMVSAHPTTVFLTLVAAVCDHPDLMASSIFRSLHQIVQTQAGTQSPLRLTYGCWLTPNVLYWEGKDDRGLWGTHTAQVLLATEHGWEQSPLRIFQLSPDEYGAIAVCPHEVYTRDYEPFTLTVIADDNLLTVDRTVADKAYSLEFTSYLNQKPAHHRHLIREYLNRAMVDWTPPALRSSVGALIRKLQYFVEVPPVLFGTENQPFQLHFDHVIPIATTGVFLSGWMLDPYQLLDDIVAVADLGIAISFKDDLYPVERADVSTSIQQTPYGAFGARGFCAYVRLPDPLPKELDGFVAFHSFRFRVKLQGGVEVDVIPPPKYHDVFTSRHLLMQQIAPPTTVSDEMLEHCIGAAAADLHQLCMAQVRVAQVRLIGQPIARPFASLIIPLYKQLDYLKVQVATLATDPDIRQCEIIYVLDSPEQATAVTAFLQEHSALYQIPFTLVVMECNSGYAAANNAGAAQARGHYLVLMNSDVFPTGKGWLSKMATFYDTSDRIGVLAPKLLYEDQSIQHAGMFFQKTTFPFWLNLHYYKGFPRSYPLAQISRRVPAVTGACLLIRRDLFEQVGGLTPDYVIGDFEDSDLCLKCAEQGYESWYFADAELFHLERQSVPLNEGYAGSLAWRYNARQHDRRWQSAIEQLMQQVAMG